MSPETPVIKSVFKDAVLNARFSRDGFVTMPLFPEAVCDEIAHGHKAIEPVWGERFYASQNVDSSEYRVQVNNILMPYFRSVAESIFVDHDLLYTNYMVKSSGENSSCNMHQDWTYVKEPRFESVTIWCPLQDVDIENGCIRVAPGSHRLRNYVRGRNMHQYTAAHSRIVRFFMRPLRLRKGEALFFNSRLVHESGDNNSAETRLAAAAMAYPREAKPIHFMKMDEDAPAVMELNVDKDFFVLNRCIGIPDEYEVLREHPAESRHAGIGEIVRVCGAPKLREVLGLEIGTFSNERAAAPK